MTQVAANILSALVPGLIAPDAAASTGDAGGLGQGLGGLGVDQGLFAGLLAQRTEVVENVVAARNADSAASPFNASLIAAMNAILQPQTAAAGQPAVSEEAAAAETPAIESAAAPSASAAALPADAEQAAEAAAPAGPAAWREAVAAKLSTLLSSAATGDPAAANAASPIAQQVKTALGQPPAAAAPQAAHPATPEAAPATAPTPAAAVAPAPAQSAGQSVAQTLAATAQAVAETVAHRGAPKPAPQAAAPATPKARDAAVKVDAAPADALTAAAEPTFAEHLTETAVAAIEEAAPDDAPLTTDARADAPAAADPALAAAAPAPVQTAAVDAPKVTVHTVAHLAAQIIQKAEGGKATRFDVTLNPEGLGKVDVRVEIGVRGDVSAQMNFDNPEVASQMRARASELQTALEQAGFDLSKTALSFNSGGTGDQSLFSQQNTGDQGGKPSWLGRAFSNLAEQIDEAVAPVWARRDTGGVDVRI